jgi:hypothetical protein
MLWSVLMISMHCKSTYVYPGEESGVGAIRRTGRGGDELAAECFFGDKYDTFTYAMHQVWFLNCRIHMTCDGRSGGIMHYSIYPAQPNPT